MSLESPPQSSRAFLTSVLLTAAASSLLLLGRELLSQSTLRTRGGGVPVTTISDHDAKGRIVGAHRARDGRVVVVTRRPAEVREYSSGGSLIAVRSSVGGGPAELRDVSWSALMADTLWTYDPSQRRVSWMRVDDWSQRGSRSIGVSASRLRIAGRLSSGELLVLLDRRTEPHDRPGLIEKVEDVALLSLGAAPAWRHINLSVSSTDLVSLGTADRLGTVISHPLSHTAFVCSAGRLTAIASSDSSAIRLLSVEPEGHSRLPLEVRPRELDRHALDESLRSIAASTESAGDLATLRLRYDRRFFPRQAPFISGLLCGSSGEVWVRPFTEDLTAPDSVFLAVPATRTSPRVGAPNGGRIAEIGDGFVVTTLNLRSGGVSVQVFRY